MPEFKEMLADRVKETEEIIKRYLPEEAGFQRTIMKAMNYSMNAGGKRIRPLLMLETGRLFGFGGARKELEHFMAAIEMIHTYSLIHDDLPALDNDDYRRGRKTAHVVYGEAMAILAGDALLNYAFETASKAFKGTEEDIRTARAFQILSAKPGIYGMIGGQTADVESEHREIPFEELLFIHKNKTAALIECAMMIGAVLAGASPEEVGIVEQIAGKTGMAFQIQDDILDLTSTQEELGKPVGSDEKNQKNTYVSMKGLEQSGKDVIQYTKEALDAFDSLHRDNAFLRDLLLHLSGRKK